MTGSSGKTTTKDFIAQLLARAGPTIAPPGSFNNELGLPYTVLKADEQTRWLVLEIGARGIGHIRDLCEIAPPRIGVVINVGVAHIGEFGSVESDRGGQGRAGRGAAGGRDRGSQRGRSTGPRDGDPDARPAWSSSARPPMPTSGPTDVVLDDRGRAALHAGHAGRHARAVQLGVTGRHQVGNTLAAAAVALAAGRATGRPGGGAGRTAAGFHTKDGCLRPRRRCHGHRRLVQRESGLDGRRAARADRPRHGPPPCRRPRLPGRVGRRTSGPATKRSASWPRASAWTG